MSIPFNKDVALEYLRTANKLIKKGSKEATLRDSFSQALPRIFPSDTPWWVSYHALGTEAHVKFNKEGKTSYGFVDTLIGSTVIEYEKDLSKASIFTEGYGQVKDYCASLLNDNHPDELIIGVLSDTVRWHAYKIKDIVQPVSKSIYGRDHIVLEEIENIDLSSGSQEEAIQLKEFLVKYLGREGARQLNADTLAHDLGLESSFCFPHLKSINHLVEQAFINNKSYAELIQQLWSDFVSYLGDTQTANSFDLEAYKAELYILTLAKLLCANILEKKALSSDDKQLTSILSGQFFKLRGLTNLVEYDYFGWLNESPYVDDLLPIAHEIQNDLRAYNFKVTPIEDLFGTLMAQLARQSHRLLLGQEWTPSWLAKKIVHKVLNDLPEEASPQLVDMCCGSGAMIIETVKQVKENLSDSSNSEQDKIATLLKCITGFDIDPLAVMLAKVSWVLAAHDWLSNIGNTDVTIPIYHADSLFAITPLSKTFEPDTEDKYYKLCLDNIEINLPVFLISPKLRIFFELLLERGYSIAMDSAKKHSPSITKQTAQRLIEHIAKDMGNPLSVYEKDETIKFCDDLLTCLEDLQRAGRNGIWAFVLRNSYRPGLVAGQFNGLVSNPPWLALSKVADNPYKNVLRERSEGYGIKPEGSSHLHVELATTFLLHAIEMYLSPNSTIGCILPESILSAHHHNPFRKAKYLTAKRPIIFHVSELWRIEKGTFKNEAVVLYGFKRKEKTIETIPGKLVTPMNTSDLTFHKLLQGQRTAWSDTLPPRKGNTGFFSPANFAQGPDIMPRTLIFHDCKPTSANNDTWTLQPIDRNPNPLRYLIAQAKKHSDFSLTANNINGSLIFDVLISNHLTPFDISQPAKALLPIEKNENSQWESITEADLTMFGTSTYSAFQTIFSEIKQDSSGFFDKLDTNRHKLKNQIIPTSGWLVFYGAGGKLVCAAYAKASCFNIDKLIIDQTLYWASISTEEEAIYLTGLLNSEAIDQVIKEFQPRGQFGERHVHKLPLGVTPPYNPNEISHSDVVDKTRKLLTEWDSKKNVDQNIQSYLDPNTAPLHIRRRKLRSNIQELSSYDNYKQACMNLYGV